MTYPYFQILLSVWDVILTWKLSGRGKNVSMEVDFVFILHVQMRILSWSGWKAPWFCEGNGRFYCCQFEVWMFDLVILYHFNSPFTNFYSLIWGLTHILITEHTRIRMGIFPKYVACNLMQTKFVLFLKMLSSLKLAKYTICIWLGLDWLIGFDFDVGFYGSELGKISTKCWGLK